MPAASTGEDSSVTRHSQAVLVFAVPDGIFTRSGGFLSCLSIKKAKLLTTKSFFFHIHGEIRTQSPDP